MSLPTKFSFVTVMNVKVIDPDITFGSEEDNYLHYADLVEKLLETDVLATIDSLSISNLTQEGPRKEARGGLYAQPQVRYGKTMRLEMEDVMASIKALDALGIVDAVIEEEEVTEVNITETFPKAMMLLGETFVIDEDGNRKWTHILFPRFLPDAIFDLTMESEGDIGMVNINGELFPDENGDFFLIGYDHVKNSVE